MENLGRWRRFFSLLLLAVIAFSVALYGSFRQQEAPGPPPEGAKIAVVVLTTLTVRDRAPKAGYNRDHFGGDWREVGGCDMRNRILQRDLDKVLVSKDDGCTVLRGTLKSDAYAGQTVAFKKGPGTSQAVQIDHIVPVSDAWQKGAQQWPPGKREAFYNDPLNLIAVHGPTNMQKGDGDAAIWLPLNKAYRCRYVARQIAVKAKYDLWVTEAERTAMQRVLFYCPEQVLPIVPGN
jgi:hypothetical protein